MLNVPDQVREIWKAQQDAKRRYGDDNASDFAVIEGVRTQLREAFDALMTQTTDVWRGTDVVHAYDILWDLLKQEHAAVLKRVAEDKEIRG